MAQPLIYAFVAELAGRVALPEPIVEFGSMQVEPGQPNDLRTLFAGRDFTGTDMRPGPGVDRVEDLRGLTFADAASGPPCAWTRSSTAPIRSPRCARCIGSWPPGASAC